MYCQNLESALDLYRSFHRSFHQTLKDKGKLLISFLSPMSGPDCERDLNQLGPEEKKLVPLIFEIVQIEYIRHLNSSSLIIANSKKVVFKPETCHFSAFRALNIAVAVK